MQSKLETLLKQVKIERPFGIFLSGGLDSGVLAAILKPDFAITCNFKGEFYDELGYAEAIADHLDIPLEIITPNGEDFEEVITKSMTILGETVNSVSIYPWYKIMDRVQQSGAKRMVGGEGSDEAFGGYSRYLILQRINDMYELDSLKQYHPMLNKIFGSFVDVHSMMTGVDKAILLKRYDEKEGFLNKVGWAEFNEYLPAVVDMEKKFAKYFGLDLYLPFMDKKVSDYGFGLEDNQKIDGEIRKKEVYEIAKKYLPEKVWQRKDKKGFGSPANEWSGSDSKYDKSKYLELQKKCSV